MNTRARRVLGAAAATAVLVLAGCAQALPEAPDAVGDDFPGVGIPTDVAWPSDWLESVPGESFGLGWPIVALRLEYIDEQWVWRVRGIEPGRDRFGEDIRDSQQGVESIIDAATLDVIAQQDVELTEAELAPDGVGVYWAAQLSGETYPSPRIIELERAIEDGASVWRITTYDNGTGIQTEQTVDAEDVPTQ